MVSPRLRKQAVVVMRSEVAVSERRACGLIQIHRGTYRYRRRPEDGQLRVRLRELAEERRRFGYRRLQVLLVREGLPLATLSRASPTSLGTTLLTPVWVLLLRI
jgi:putative transposase